MKLYEKEYFLIKPRYYLIIPSFIDIFAAENKPLQL